MIRSTVFLACMGGGAHACEGLRCLIHGSLVWSKPGWGSLQLNISEDQTRGLGELQVAGEPVLEVEAAVKWAEGSEVLIKWAAGGAAFSGLVVLSDATQMLVHGSQASHPISLFFRSRPSHPHPVPYPTPTRTNLFAYSPT